MNEARDWQGNEIRCGQCPHRALLDAGRCRLRHVCVQDRYARRIDRSQLPLMAADTDANVRLEVAQRMSPDQLAALLRDSDCRVRYEVASRIGMKRLGALLEDPDSLVRELARDRLEAERSPSAEHNACP